MQKYFCLESLIIVRDKPTLLQEGSIFTKRTNCYYSTVTSLGCDGFSHGRAWYSLTWLLRVFYCNVIQIIYSEHFSLGAFPLIFIVFMDSLVCVFILPSLIHRHSGCSFFSSILFILTLALSGSWAR